MMTGAATLVALGAIAMACLVAGLLFFRFWRDTHDRLFFLFGLAFSVEAVNRLGLALSARPNEGDVFFYVVRLLTFGLIVIAILDKNRRDGSP